MVYGRVTGQNLYYEFGAAARRPIKADFIGLGFDGLLPALPLWARRHQMPQLSCVCQTCACPQSYACAVCICIIKRVCEIVGVKMMLPDAR